MNEIEEASSESTKNESKEGEKEDYKFPDDVYHSCYTLTSEKQETFRFSQISIGKSNIKLLFTLQVTLRAQFNNLLPAQVFIGVSKL